MIIQAKLRAQELKYSSLNNIINCNYTGVIYECSLTGDQTAHKRSQIVVLKYKQDQGSKAPSAVSHISFYAQ